MAHHVLKIEDCFYHAKIAEDKLFEIRYNGDKGFQKGDTVSYLTENGTFEREGVWEITYVCSYAQKDNFIVFGEVRLQTKMEKSK